MIEPQFDEDDRVVGTVTIYRILSAEGQMRDQIVSDDMTKEGGLDAFTIVSMLAVAQHSVLCEGEGFE